MHGTMSFGSDWVDINSLQNLQGTFSQLFGCAIQIVNTDGSAITQPSGQPQSCRTLLRNKNVAQGWQKTMRAVCKKNTQKLKPVLHRWPGLGLCVAGAPFISQGRCVASCIIGPARLAITREDTVLKEAFTLGIEATLLEKGIDELPVLTSQQLVLMGDYLQVLMHLINKLRQTDESLHSAGQKRRSLYAINAEAAQMLGALSLSNGIGLVIADTQTGEILLASEGFAQMAAKPRDELVGQNCREVIFDGQPPPFAQLCPTLPSQAPAAANTPQDHEIYSNNMGLHLRCTGQPIKWLGERRACLITLADVSAKYHMQKEVARLAFHDAQMALPNMLKLSNDLQTGVYATDGSSFLVCFDIAALRRINNAYSRRIGDKFLLEIVRWVQTMPIQNSTFYRIGGDEFCVALCHTSQAQAEKLASQIFERFHDVWLVEEEGKTFTISCSAWVSVIGINQWLTQDDNYAGIIDRTLETSRRENRVTLYDEQLDAALRLQSQMEVSLRRCIQAGMTGFSVHYQPIVDPAAGRWVAMEALCRWESPTLGEVQPEVFIGVAERMGLISTLGAWVLDTAVHSCKQWRMDEQEDFTLTVNVSPAQFASTNFVQQVFDTLKRYNYPGTSLCLEITESKEVIFDASVKDIMTQLQAEGIKIALDDFGTGYSTFNHLKNLPVKILKTERTFVENIENDKFMQQFFFTMSELAHTAGIKLLAEGVETAAQLDVVLRNGADYVQGFYFSHPVSATHMQVLLPRFHQVDSAFHLGGTGTMDIKKLFDTINPYVSSPKLYGVLNQCIYILLTESSLKSAFEQVIAIVGKALNLYRVRVFLWQTKQQYRNVYEWYDKGAKPSKPELPYIINSGNGSGDVWLDYLIKNGMLLASNVATLPNHMAEDLLEDEIKSLAMFPLLDDNNTLIGFVGFDDNEFREWRPAEAVMLSNLSMTMAITLRKLRLQNMLQSSDTYIYDMLNQMHLGIYVTDLATDKVLWINDVLRETLPDQNIAEGHPCYAMMFGRHERCLFCGLNRARLANTGEEQRWGTYNQQKDKYFSASSQLIRWKTGKMAHLCIIQDVTEQTKDKQRLEYFATTDALTGALNRNKLQSILREMIQTDTQKHLTVAFIDIDKLKLANDTYGHSFGDMLIKKTVGVLRPHLGQNGVLGRVGGDEFVVVLPGTGRAKVNKILAGAREALQSMHLAPGGEDFSFSYGVAEKSEVTLESTETAIEALLQLADERMMHHKRENVPANHLR